MTRTTSTARRATLAVALAATAAFGSVALAPAASASLALDGSTSVISGTGVGGPVAFLVTENGRVAVFYCDAAKWNKLQNVCQEDPTTVRF